MLEEALQEHEKQVDTLLKAANRYVGALKTWKKACQLGHINNLQKAAAQAEELGTALPVPTSEARSSWDFDVRAYLESEAWREELQQAAAEQFTLRTLALDEEEALISSPITVRARPGTQSLLLGKQNWPTLRPKVIAAELKRLRDRNTGANSQEFMESLCAACQYLHPDGSATRFKDIYDLFCLTPGYKRENPPAAFGQMIYAMHRSELRATRNGRKYEMEYATGNVKERDVYSVRAEDGRLLRYYSIWFK